MRSSSGSDVGTRNWRQSLWDFLASNWLQLTLVALMVFIVVWMSQMLMVTGITQRDVALITGYLTVASVVASWIISKLYAEASSSKHLRDQGVQIAIGVMLLKNQIENLCDWVDSKSDGLLSGDAATQSILEHIGETLLVFREMSDASLSAIGSVIGDALAQYDDVMKRVASARASAFQQTAEIESRMEQTSSAEEIAHLQAKIVEIAEDTKRQISQLKRSSALPISEPTALRTVTVQCPDPHCAQNNSFEMKGTVGQTSLRRCEYCGHNFNVHITAGNRVISRPYAPPGTANSALPPELQRLLSDLWIEPGALARLIPIIVKTSKGLSAEERTPYQLQERVLQSPDLVEAGIRNVMVRRFFYRAYKSRVFIFADKPHFHNTYMNDLTDVALLEAYARALVWKVYHSGNHQTLGVEELTKALFGSNFPNAHGIVRDALAKAALPTDAITASSA